MKINEVEQLNEGLGDWMRAAAYNTLGVGGDKGNQAANMYKFTDGFKQMLGQTSRAAKDAGIDMDYNQLIDSYLAKYGWQASKKQKKALLKLTNDPGKLAKAMYVVGMSQPRDNNGYMMGTQGYQQRGRQGQQRQPGRAPKIKKNSAPVDRNNDGVDDMTGGQVAQSTGGAGAFGSMASQLGAEGPNLGNKTQQLISAIQNLRGADNLDDLAAITKTAMQVLYSQDKSTYNDLYKEIMTGQKGPGTMADAFASRRVEKQKAAANAANASATPFSRLPTAAPAAQTAPAAQATPTPTTPDDISARRIAKQKAATAALNGPASTRVPSMSADDLAARRIAKQKAAAAALNMK
jgi:hypothetical protein